MGDRIRGGLPAPGNVGVEPEQPLTILGALSVVFSVLDEVDREYSMIDTMENGHKREAILEVRTAVTRKFIALDGGS